MNNIRLIILVVIIFLLGVAGIYWIYQSQVSKSEEQLLPLPSPQAFDDLVSPSPTPTPPVGANGPIPPVQPEAGFDTQTLEFPELP